MTYIFATKNWSNFVQIEAATDKQAYRIARKAFMDRLFPEILKPAPRKCRAPREEAK